MLLSVLLYRQEKVHNQVYKVNVNWLTWVMLMPIPNGRERDVKYSLTLFLKSKKNGKILKINFFRSLKIK